MLLTELGEQPRARHRPVGLDGSGRHTENFSGLFDTESREIAQLDNAGVARAALCEPAQCVVEIDELRGVGIHGRLIIVETYELDALSSFDCESASRPIHEYLAHGAADCGEEVSASTLRNPGVVNQPEINLVNKRGRLERILTPLIGEPAMRERSQLLVDTRDELVDSVVVAVFCGFEQISCRGAKRLLWIHARPGVTPLWITTPAIR